MEANGKEATDQQVARALRWISDVFACAGAQYQVVGGLAARAFGATRPLVDLDFYVRAEDLTRVLASVGDSCIWGPEHFKDEKWDLTFAKLERYGVQIELAEAEGAQYYSSGDCKWLDQNVAFHASERCVVLGVEIAVMSKEQLVAYKRALDRPVDRLDLHEIAD